MQENSNDIDECAMIEPEAIGVIRGRSEVFVELLNAAVVFHDGLELSDDLIWQTEDDDKVSLSSKRP